MKKFKTTSNWIIYGRQEGKFTSIELKEGEVLALRNLLKETQLFTKIVNFL